ncbi:protoporphyrinogen oxidase HemJ [Acetobacter senegalensis]|uniref:protoporphyrinogen oxidase HemJ n=1 Tax=Acetobacter senegalensis TaxID=446692 RepID=UPI00128B1306|nr:protoporphyrinogen oxidase HemJ [Acetobacter senegalensis]MCG4257889.1 protoporphyrinogen oxidase HemJ [Acetobacter senegalensis]MCG4267816.1 protoporphyrinogen oxidase HemJ [Acetobacter senegalensis]MPQ73438.1 protoporphyrinogen oxidase HemJ [Acetobacter senegalensis]
MTIEAFLPWTRWFLAFHVMSVMAWMAGMFYLPRLFVYHCQVQIGSEESARFKIMERRLLRAIINPAMISSLLFGIFLVLTPGAVDWHAGWWHCKMAALLGMFAFHGFCARWRKDFEKDQNRHPERYYRIANEVPTVLMMIIVIMVIVRPF